MRMRDKRGKFIAHDRTDGMKVCPRCGINKELSEYYKDRHQFSGITSVCMACLRDKSRIYLKTEVGKRNMSRKYEKFMREQKHKYQAQYKLRYAVQQGDIQRSTICEICFEERRIEAHHHDYSKPYDVQWLCSVCHRLVEGKLRDFNLLSKNLIAQGGK